MHKLPTIHHNKVNPQESATRDPNKGPQVCAVAQAIVYNPAYWPLLCAALLLVQKAFMNGIENISPKVISKIMNTAGMYVR